MSIRWCLWAHQMIECTMKSASNILRMAYRLDDGPVVSHQIDTSTSLLRLRDAKRIGKMHPQRRDNVLQVVSLGSRPRYFRVDDAQ